mgnify:CR=1 FL=1
MKIKRFVAQDMRQALRMVREALGEEAVILSNKSIDGGVELMAAIDFDQASIAESEELAGHLRGCGVPCDVLNARNDEEEAAIIARAMSWGALFSVLSLPLLLPLLIFLIQGTTAVAIGALGIALAMSFGVGTMVRSFRDTVATWLDDALRADIYVTLPSTVSRQGSDDVLDPEVFEKYLATPHGTDFVAVAGALGVEGQQVDDVATLQRLLAEPCGSPRLVQVTTDRRANRDLHRLVNARLAEAITSQPAG